MLALHDENTIYGTYQEQVGWVILPDGSQISPPTDGWTNGVYSLNRIRPGEPAPEGKITSSQTIILDDDGIPKYEYTYEDEPAPEIPDRVTARQFMIMLDMMDLYDQVESWIETQDRKIQLAFRHSGTFVKDEPMMQSGFTSLGFTSEQIDNFFVAASQI